MPKLTDAELVTLAVQQALLGCCSEPAGWATPTPTSGSCSRICPSSLATTSLRAAANLLGQVIAVLASDTTFWTLHGLPVGFALAGANTDERQVLLGILAADPTLVATRPGQT